MSPPGGSAEAAVRLPSLSPFLLRPNQQLFISAPWLSNPESTHEMTEKMALAARSVHSGISYYFCPIFFLGFVSHHFQQHNLCQMFYSVLSVHHFQQCIFLFFLRPIHACSSQNHQTILMISLKGEIFRIY